MRNRPFAACRCRCLLDIAPCRRPLFAGWHDEFLLNDLRISTRLLVILTFYEKAHFFFGTLAPFFLASESPIAMACLRVFTRPPDKLIAASIQWAERIMQKIDDRFGNG